MLIVPARQAGMRKSQRSGVRAPHPGAQCPHARRLRERACGSVFCVTAIQVELCYPCTRIGRLAPATSVQGIPHRVSSCAAGAGRRLLVVPPARRALPREVCSCLLLRGTYWSQDCWLGSLRLGALIHSCRASPLAASSRLG